MVWLGFFEKNVFLRTSGVRAKPSKRISTFSVAKGLIDLIENAKKIKLAYLIIGVNDIRPAKAT